jgi:type II secretory pathway pseudopilin PulG
MIELLIVIVVLGLLAAMVVFALGGVTAESTSAACNSDAKTTEIAVNAFHYSPANPAPGWPAASPAGNAQLTAPAAAGYGGPYLSAWPKSTHYSISIDANGDVLVNNQPYDPSSGSNPCSSLP